jgi:hypothetical protein
MVFRAGPPHIQALERVDSSAPGSERSSLTGTLPSGEWLISSPSVERC